VHLDWHPELYRLATASRDRQICIFDVNSDQNNAVETLTHSESVTSIKWRPNRARQITACSTGVFAHLYVWDLNRPYVPYASFDLLTNKVQNFMWRNTPKVIIASTREHIYNVVIDLIFFYLLFYFAEDSIDLI
jgi:WD40 repeat protein